MTTTPPIAGYTPLGPEKVAMMNQNKVIEELVLRQVDRHVANGSTDQRLVALARTHLQIAFMCLNRSVAQPTRVEGDLDIEALVKELAHV